MYEQTKQALFEDFFNKAPDQFPYVNFQNVSQRRDEIPEAFSDWCCKLCSLTITKSNNTAERRAINEEAQCRLLAAFVNGCKDKLINNVDLYFQ